MSLPSAVEISHPLLNTIEDGIYKRSVSKTRTALQNKLLSLYGLSDSQHFAYILTSGTNAIAAVVSAAIHEHKASQDPAQSPVLLISDELYSGTAPAIEYCSQMRGNVEIVEFNVTQSPEEHFVKYGSRVLAVFFEACSNPHGLIPNFESITQLRNKHCPQSTIVIDNTWMSPVGFNPFDHGADVVLESFAKYLSGGTMFGGHCIVRQKHHIAEHIYSFIRKMGQHVPDSTCQHMLSALDSIKERVTRASQNAEIAIRTLIDAKCTVWHPFINNADEAKRLYAVQPACFIIELPIPSQGSKTKTRAWFTERVSKLAPNVVETSFGGHATRIDNWTLTVRFDGDSKTLQSFGQIRLAVGYEADFESVVQGIVALVRK